MLEYSLLTRASLVTQLLKNPSAMQETLDQFLGWEDLLEKEGIGYPLQYSWEIGRAHV